MNYRTWAVALACFCTSYLPSAQAQTVQQADYIVAVVNSASITNNEVRARVQNAVQQLTQQHQNVPGTDVLRREVLERMINERAQLQLAEETGIRVDDANIDQAEQAIARQNQVDVAVLRARMAKEGVSVATFRAQLRDQQMLARLHEREVGSRIRISEQDIDRYLEEQLSANTDPYAQTINLAQILIAVPEKATPAQVAQLQDKAQRVLQRIRGGEDFTKVMLEVSAAQKTNDGQLGLRRADRYPPSFVQATQALAVGGVSEIVRSGAGFHILKVVEKRAPTALVRTVVQSHAQHILLRTDAKLTQAAAIERLVEFKKRIQSGQATFAALAREYSQDGSAAQGGDLGWANPGMFVPEFDDAMNRLAEGEISNPVVSRFGVHLILLVERRRVELNPRELRESVRYQLRESRYETAYAAWAHDVRARAFVEMREPPQ